VIRIGLIGIGKMGMSHFAILGAHPDVQIRAVCDRAIYLTTAVKRHTGVKTYKDYREMIDKCDLDAVLVATPSSTHFGATSYALEHGLHAFVEKPLCLDPADSKRLAELAASKRRVSQVGYHNRFIGTFRETRRLVQAGALGDVYHVTGTAFGQVVIRPKTGNTWRNKKASGGGCLHDYASHVVDLMGFIAGAPEKVTGAELRSIFSAEVEDAVYAMTRYPNGATGYIEANWSDETHRKMSTTITVFGTKGKIVVDRQECRVFLRSGAEFENYPAGWTIRYITDLQEPVAYYLRGEEYSAQIDRFVSAIQGGPTPENTFATSYETDRTIHQIMKCALGE
jgi:scyllo-inositol 2-dehydrogenase (NADP+)